MSSDGRVYNYQTANIAHTEDHEESNMIGMETIQSDRAYSNTADSSIPGYQPQIRRSPPIYVPPTASDLDDSSYEHVRINASEMAADKSSTASPSSRPGGTAGNNAFRDQVYKNNLARAGV